jgi:hypothetical protein
MTKRWIVLALAVALALAVVPLAAASNGGGGEKGKGKLKFELVGTVSVVGIADELSGETTLTVYVKAGNKPVKWSRGEDLPLVVPAGTRVRIVTAEGCKTMKLADVPVGAKVKVRGLVRGLELPKPDRVYVALDIKARALAEPTLPPPPEPGQ